MDVPTSSDDSSDDGGPPPLAQAGANRSPQATARGFSGLALPGIAAHDYHSDGVGSSGPVCQKIKFELFSVQLTNHAIKVPR
jgi:hypothetical protein